MEVDVLKNWRPFWRASFKFVSVWIQGEKREIDSQDWICLYVANLIRPSIPSSVASFIQTPIPPRVPAVLLSNCLAANC